MIPRWVQRIFWGRTGEESAALAEREAYAREVRAALSEEKRRGECYVVHAPEIWGGYCEIHAYPVYRSNSCDLSRLHLKKAAPEWTITE